MKTYQHTIIQKLTLVLAGLLILFGSGCGTTRKQYAINEAILISERRQLEDEIYRMRFMLKEYESENQRLRDQLQSNADSSQKTENDGRRLPPFQKTGPLNVTGNPVILSTERDVAENVPQEVLPDSILRPVASGRASAAGSNRSAGNMPEPYPKLQIPGTVQQIPQVKSSKTEQSGQLEQPVKIRPTNYQQNGQTSQTVQQTPYNDVDSNSVDGNTKYDDQDAVNWSPLNQNQ